MKYQTSFCTLLLLFALISPLNGQLIKDHILTSTKRNALRESSIKYELEYKRDSIIKYEAARKYGWPTENLYNINARGNPIYEVPTNNDAANITGTSSARTQLNTSGSGMVMAMWETGPGGIVMPRITHQDFSDGASGSRIIYGDSQITSSPSDHATHVAGTLIGNPPNDESIDSRGMAYDATLKAFGSLQDLSEMAIEAQNGLLVSNHSYGWAAGWGFSGYKKWTWYGGSATFQSGGDDPTFGEYSYKARSVDNISYMAPYYLSVWSAGNDNTSNPISTSPVDSVRNGVNGAFVAYDPNIHPLGDADQSCNIGLASYLNALVVGNVTKNLTIEPSSSRGLLDDGRLGVDICGIGSFVYSAAGLADDTYSSESGTSTSAPNVAGSLLILQDGYEKIHGSLGNYMRGATLKALVSHTALDLGDEGPDDTFGWGLLDAEEATKVIQEDAWLTTNSGHRIIEDVLSSPSDIKTYEVNAEPGETFKVTLAYYDPVDLSTYVALQNDLDLQVIAPSGTSNLPLSTNGNGNTGDNDLENVEQVKIGNAVGGIYEIQVSLEGTSLYNDDPQHFSLIISGMNTTCHKDIIHSETINLQSGTYRAISSITSSTSIDQGKEVHYRWGDKVILKPGFRAPIASKFNTEQGTCN